MPVVSMSMRLMIGIVQMLRRRAAGRPAPSPRADGRASCPARHWSRGFRCTIVSVMLSGDGSVEVSARRLSRRRTRPPETACRAAFCRCAIRVFSSSEMLGSAIGMNIRSPSFSGGMNSLPIRAADDQRAGEQQRRRTRRVTPRCDSAALEHRTVERAQHPHHRVVLLRVKLAAEQQRAQHRHQRDRDERRREHGKGLGERQRVKQLAFLSRQREHRDEREQDDRHREEHRASDQPRRLEDGVATPRADRADRRRCCSRKRNAFSVTTMPASTSTPMAMAMPARLMMFERCRRSACRGTTASTASGSGSVTIRIERKCTGRRRAPA